MSAQQVILKPQDILLLLKVVRIEKENWNQKPMALALAISQSEVSESDARSKYAGWLSTIRKKVMRLSLLEFFPYGLRYVFPQINLVLL
jgi:hypothetical protein